MTDNVSLMNYELHEFLGWWWGVALYEARLISVLNPPGHTALRSVRPGVGSSQGRWPCAGLRPAVGSHGFLTTKYTNLSDGGG